MLSCALVLQFAVTAVAEGGTCVPPWACPVGSWSIPVGLPGLEEVWAVLLLPLPWASLVPLFHRGPGSTTISFLPLAWGEGTCPLICQYFDWSHWLCPFLELEVVLVIRLGGVLGLIVCFKCVGIFVKNWGKLFCALQSLILNILLLFFLFSAYLCRFF